MQLPCYFSDLNTYLAFINLKFRDSGSPSDLDSQKVFGLLVLLRFLPCQKAQYFSAPSIAVRLNLHGATMIPLDKLKKKEEKVYLRLFRSKFTFPIQVKIKLIKKN